MLKRIGRIITTILALFGGKKALKKKAVQYIVKLLTEQLVDPVELADAVHDEVQRVGRNVLGEAGYEFAEDAGPLPFAKRLVERWEED